MRSKRTPSTSRKSVMPQMRSLCDLKRAAKATHCTCGGLRVCTERHIYRSQLQQCSATSMVLVQVAKAASRKCGLPAGIKCALHFSRGSPLTCPVAHAVYDKAITASPEICDCTPINVARSPQSMWKSWEGVLGHQFTFRIANRHINPCALEGSDTRS
jgi:hypothetical protein